MKVYFDNSATTKVYDEAIDVMIDVMKNNYGNPSSINKMGTEVEVIIKEAKQTIARTIKSKAEEIVFTSGGTESNNIAIQGYLRNKKHSGKHIITSVIEHPSVLNTFQRLEEQGFKVTYLGVNEQGLISMADLREAITDETCFVSMMYVNNELGSIQPIEEIGKMLKNMKQEIVFHVDAVQGYGKLDCNVRRLNCQLLSISSHKINGPKGSGCLYIKKGINIKPLFYGGGQENGLRVGTENVPGIVGFAKAAEITHRKLAKNSEHIDRLKKRFVENLETYALDYKINSNADVSASHVLNVSFRGIKGEILVHSLETKEIYVSTGSACSSKKRVNSHVLQAIGLDLLELEGAIRFSFNGNNTLEEVDYCTEILNETVTMLRNIIKGRV